MGDDQRLKAALELLESYRLLVDTARNNNLARKNRRMLSDMADVLCFKAVEGPVIDMRRWSKVLTDEHLAVLVVDHADELRRLLDGPRP
jgi:hypothetical protein